MTGNACELVNDERGPLPGGVDPYIGSGGALICRGGSFDASYSVASLGSRKTFSRTYFPEIGFRLVRTLGE